jgi:hypothetical protein
MVVRVRFDGCQMLVVATTDSPAVDLRLPLQCRGVRQIQPAMLAFAGQGGDDRYVEVFPRLCNAGSGNPTERP